MIGTIVGVAALCIVVGFTAGAMFGERYERAYWRKERDAILHQWESRVAALNADLTRQNTAVYRLRADLAAKQRRVRGLLTEARRWKTVAEALGWKRETRGEMHARQRREAGET